MYVQWIALLEHDMTMSVDDCTAVTPHMPMLECLQAMHLHELCVNTGHVELHNLPIQCLTSGC